MLQAMQGILADTPKIQEVAGLDGKPVKVAAVNLLYWDGRAATTSCLVQILAWNEQAEQLAKYEAGDEIQFVARLNAKLSRDGKQTELSFAVQRIDDSGTLVAATEQFLRDFMSDRKERLSDQILRAEEQKERNDAAGKGPEQKIHQP